LSPLLFGFIMDQNLPRWVFAISALFMVLTVVLAPFTERKPRAIPARAGTA
jgi:MFS family permease